jgi:prevent-host-death family protein
MREIGVRELKQSLSKTLRSVSHGEQVRVTLRGRPLADIVPAVAASEDDQLRRLVAEGRLAAPARVRPTQAPPLAESEVSASSLVLSDREVER